MLPQEIRNCITRTLSAGIPTLLLVHTAYAAPSPTSANNSKYVIALAPDSRNNVWAATEDKGVLRLDTSLKPLVGSLTGNLAAVREDGSDGYYAVAVDQQNRVWVGTSRHGVKVWNGKAWRTYGVLDGPIGERIFDIAVAPHDGSVWMATSAGLSRYIPKADKWQHFTRGNGLPSDQISSIAFDQKGNIVVGTQCDGIALADVANEYSKWRKVAAPRAFDTVPFGKGLGSAQINDVLVASDKTIYAATSCGLAWSKDAGKTWSYVRGENYADRVRGRYGGAPYARWQPKAGAVLKEDYVTCLAQSDGKLWLGYRQRGWDCFDLKTQNRVRSGEADYVRAILTRENQTPLLATYGSGLVEIPAETADAKKTVAAKVSAPTSSTRSSDIPPLINRKANAVLPQFPSPQAAPNLAQMQTMLRQLARVRAETRSVKKPTPTKLVSASKAIAAMPKVFALNDDWNTRGNWIDRYGRFAIRLCAMGGGGFDLQNGYRAAWWEVRSYIGRNNSKDQGVKPGQNDQLRYWVHWPRTDDERSLQNPTMGGRKQSEWDDHGENYPMHHDGPHVYATVKIPKGRYVLSCYIFNKDGWDGANRWRDYLLEVRPTPIESSKFDKLGLVGRDAERIFESTAVGAQSRVVDFRGGVWKRFLIDARDDEYWTVALKRNGSFNTILSAVALDPIADLGGAEGPRRQPPVAYQSRLKLDVNRLPKTAQGASLLLIDRLLWLRDANPTWSFLHGRKFAFPLLRALLNKDKAGKTLAERVEKNGSSPKLRPEIAQLLNDAQLLNGRDTVFYTPDHYLTYAHEGKTAKGEAWNSWTWDYDEYDRFIQTRQSKHTW